MICTGHWRSWLGISPAAGAALSAGRWIARLWLPGQPQGRGAAWAALAALAASTAAWS